MCHQMARALHVLQLPLQLAILKTQLKNFPAMFYVTIWPSGLRSWLQAPVRNGVGSNPTAVTFSCTGKSSPHQEPPYGSLGPPCFTVGILAQGRVRGSSRAGRRPAQAWSGGLPIPIYSLQQQAFQDSLAEWSKALASGASPQGRGFEPHSCHFQLRLRFLARPGTSRQHPRPTMFYRGHLGSRSGPRLKPGRPPPGTSPEWRPVYFYV